ncbi:RagB/SusD family nutrient uptake outer membrane protein [Maribacter halichondriae]|uniref:RagB/SusD family nutrient uptake outer membrane protein n=1 Tax=Maribacter halichondriae TaxID=2980554 RepID=UPI0023591C01|nr:RagB/SusD family nutrient uptake outer membrane protein [Maribacter sp. Hal144]
MTSDAVAVTQKGGDWFDGGIWIQLHRHTYGSTHDRINELWNQSYTGIGECNTSLAGSLDANQTAQVRALRAYLYWRLLDGFGRVKLITAPGADAPQSDRQAVFDFVEAELLGALGVPAITASLDLSGSPLTTEVNNYRINQYAALAIIAKLYLNAEAYTGTPRWQEAEWATSYILDNSPYQLCGAGCTVPNLAKRPEVPSDPENLEGYSAIFAPNNEGNPEIIWAVDFDENNTANGGMNFNMMTLHGPSQLTWGLDAQPWNGFVVLEEFYNSHGTDDGRRQMNFLQGPQTDFGGNPLLDYAADDDDLVIDYKPPVNELEPNAKRDGGVRMGKFGFAVFQRQNMNNDYPIVRLGDVHLMHAEAASRAAGDWSLALPEVNVLRARVGAAPLTTMDAASFLAERGKEMFQESSRRTDQIRFGTYEDQWWEKTDSDPNKRLFPIPQGQIDASGGSLTQNPGY